MPSGRLRTAYGAVGAVVHLLPLREKREWRDVPLDAWRKHVQLDVKSLYALVQAAEGDLQKARENQTARWLQQSPAEAGTSESKRPLF